MEVITGSWDTEEGAFVGNECSWETPSGRLHGCKQHHVNQKIVEMARALGGRIILTLDSHFVRPETKMVQDILLQNGNKTGWRASYPYYQMSTQQAWAEWRENHHMIDGYQAIFQEGVESNHHFAEMIEPISIKKGYHLPEVDLPPSIRSSTKTYDEALMQLTIQRIREHGRMGDIPENRVGEYYERLERELKVIAENGKINFLPYFLTIDLQVTSYMQSIGKIVGPGRGSAAGCLLSYLLRITHLDPIRWGLSFERFLSMGRISRGKFPDIDMDFGDPKDVVAHLGQVYGDKFARICTTGTAKLKGAIRDVSRILLNTSEDKEMAKRVNDLCLILEASPQGADEKKWLYGYEDSEGNHPGYINICPELEAFFNDHPQVKDMVNEVLGVPRAVGRHASAYCVSDVPVGELVPMCSVKDEQCTQFTMGPVEKLGLIKMDFLGLNTLNDITGAVENIRKRRGFTIDIYRMEGRRTKRPERGEVIGVDIECPATFDEFCKGHTETVFQFKTKVATPLCLDIQPRSLMDLANITANGRPGTMYAKMEDGVTTLIESWVARRKGTEQIHYLHPDLKEILEPTDGIFTFQEQIMAAFVKCCGYSEEKSDEIRETIGKKKADQMAKIIPDIRSRLSAAGWTESQVTSFISLCEAASSYSFNKSHSLCYAYLGYICMWLKTNFKIEWWQSVLQNANFDDMRDAAKYIHDIVEPPDINKSELDFYIINDHGLKLVFPLNRVKNVKNAGAAIQEARMVEQDGVKRLVPFSSIEDFYNRVDRRLVNKRVVASLIWAGAFDSLYEIDDILGRNQIFRKYLEIKKDKMVFVDRTFHEATLTQMELLAIGTSDILPFIQAKVGNRVIGPERALKLGDGARAYVGGMCTSVSVVKTKTGKNPGRNMAFLSLEDNGSTIEATIFPDKYDELKPLLSEGVIICVDGKLQNWKGKKSLVANDVRVIREEIEQLSEEN